MNFVQQCEQLIAELTAEIEGLRAAIRAYTRKGGTEPTAVVPRKEPPAATPPAVVAVRKRAAKTSRKHAKAGVVEALRRHGGKASFSDVATALGVSSSTASRWIRWAVRSREVEKVGRNYRLPSGRGGKRPWGGARARAAKPARAAQRRTGADRVGKPMLRKLVELFAAFDGADVRMVEVEQHFRNAGYSTKSAGVALTAAIRQGLIERVAPSVYRVRVAGQGEPTAQEPAGDVVGVL